MWVAGSLRYTTTMDGGSAGNAGSNYLSVHPVHTRTAILGSLRYTVHPVHKKSPEQSGLFLSDVLAQIRAK